MCYNMPKGADMPTKVFSVRTSERVYERLRTIASARKKTVNGLVNELVEGLVEQERPVSLREALGDYVGKFSSGKSDSAADHDAIVQDILVRKRRERTL